MEAMRDSACAALEEVDDMGNINEEEEEEEDEYTPGGRPPLAAFSNVRASTPGAHGTPSVSRRGGRNDHWSKRSPEKVNASNEDEELPE